MNDRKKFYLIFNPAANMGRAAKMIPLVEEFFNKWKIDYKLDLTRRPKEAEEMAARAAENYDTVVALGGDGTINEVVNGALGKRATLGIVPIGAGNDFAKALGLKKNIKENLEIILRGEEKRVDVGQVNNRYFTNVLGVGFDATVAREMFARPRFLKGMPVYFYSLIKALRKYHFIKVRISAGGRNSASGRSPEGREEKELLMAAVTNGNFFGGGFKITPAASIRDGLFDLCLVEKMSRLYLLKNITKLIKGTHTELPEVEIIKTDKIIIESEKELPVEYDGELLAGTKKLAIKILPGALKIISQ